MATKAARDLLVIGLRNAHAMENQAEELMERQIERSNDFPMVQARLRQHLQETREQKSRLEKCLQSLGESPSTLKDTAMSFLGNVAALGHTAASDEILKNAFANAAFENYEIAAYKSLLTLCQRAQVDGFAAPLEASLREEEKMATWVNDNLEKVTLSYLEKREAEAA
ncbi:MAG TPA: ferritin-like domain-containing protein [Methylovirgula sp.]|nr:ferritin-like domain-containing protein [Methylovirgula sp.]